MQQLYLLIFLLQRTKKVKAKVSDSMKKLKEYIDDRFLYMCVKIHNFISIKMIEIMKGDSNMAISDLKANVNIKDIVIEKDDNNNNIAIVLDSYIDGDKIRKTRISMRMFKDMDIDMFNSIVNRSCDSNG